MATIGAKRTLQAAERAMNLAPGISQSAETTAFFIRCGLSGSAEFVPNDCLLMSRIMAGHYPQTMTADDIADVRKIDQMFEDAC